jgi:hypothetical protein
MERLFFNKLSLPVWGFLLLLVSGSPIQISFKTSAFYQSFDIERQLAPTADEFTEDSDDSVLLPSMFPLFKGTMSGSTCTHIHNKDHQDINWTQAIRGPPVDHPSRRETFNELS